MQGIKLTTGHPVQTDISTTAPTLQTEGTSQKRQKDCKSQGTGISAAE